MANTSKVVAFIGAALLVYSVGVQGVYSSAWLLKKLEECGAIDFIVSFKLLFP